MQDSIATCYAPAKLKDMLIGDVQLNSFACNNEGDKGCLGNDYCPFNCICAGTIIRCSKTNSTEIPSDVPIATTEL